VGKLSMDMHSAFAEDCSMARRGFDLRWGSALRRGMRPLASSVSKAGSLWCDWCCLNLSARLCAEAKAEPNAE
jgi:hypothetical protein